MEIATDEELEKAFKRQVVLELFECQRRGFKGWSAEYVKVSFATVLKSTSRSAVRSIEICLALPPNTNMALYY